MQRRPAIHHAAIHSHSQGDAMTYPLNQFRSVITAKPSLRPTDDALRMSSGGRFTTHYAPFEHINTGAKVVLLGITPGAFQAEVALSALRQALVDGADDATALVQAKKTASFSGPMRTNLVQLLDAVGVQRAIGIGSCAELFGARTDLVHFTSALRYPVFMDGENYSGTPAILRTPYLSTMVDTWLREEAAQLSQAIWVPLGREPSAVVDYLVAGGVIASDHVLKGLPHPSGANAERIAYFLGRKNRADLSAKTSADDLDEARERLIALVSGIDSNRRAPAMATTGPSTTVRSVTPAQRGVGAIGLTHKASLAEKLIADRLTRIAAGTKKVAGFETHKGRHIAIERDNKVITIWTEDLDTPLSLGAFQRYPATKPRHSNLAAQARRVSFGQPARKWQFEDLDRVQALLDWYVEA